MTSVNRSGLSPLSFYAQIGILSMRRLLYLLMLLAVRLAGQVSPGMSEADLLALKGPPTGKLVAGSRSIYRWSDISVVVQDGIVARATPNAASPAPPTPPPPEDSPSASEAALPFEHPAAPVHYTSNFVTHWQDESQYIVENVSADLVEMFSYARTGQVPAAGTLSVSAVEDGPDGYVVSVQNAAEPLLQARLVIQSTIFDAGTFQPLLEALAKRYGALLPTEGIEVSGLLESLTVPRAEVIETANQAVSRELERNFSSPMAHEQAALVLAAFMLREHSGKFFQILGGLCRASAHLVFARTLRGGADAGIEGRMAEAAQLSLVNNSAGSQALLQIIPSALPGVDAWRRALEIRNTQDFRKYDLSAAPTLLERFERFSARLPSGEGAAWDETAKLSPEERALPDWGRMAYGVYFSVGVGRRLADSQFKAEFAEIEATYKLARGTALGRNSLVHELNTPSPHCFAIEAGGRPHPQAIGWGLWAGFFQRELCQDVCGNFDLLANQWGVPDAARDFRKAADREFWRLQLYPFVRRQNASSAAYYRSAQDDEMALVRSQPQVVPAAVWNYIDWAVGKIPVYVPPPHPFVNEWHKRNPPPGTAYDIDPRLMHPSLTAQPDTIARLEHLHEISPWQWYISRKLLEIKYQKKATGDQAAEAYKELSGYDCFADDEIAKAYRAAKDPDQFTLWETRAAALNPVFYYPLADALKEAGKGPEAVAAYENAFGRDDNAIRVANKCEWVILYYETHGRADDATRLADKAAEVYSFAGLAAKARLLEMRKDFDGALGIYNAINERYNSAVPLLRFLLRVHKTSPSPKFDEQLKAAAEQSMTGGLVAVDLASLVGPPTDGVLASSENAQTKEGGLQLNDVIVGLNGYRVRDFNSYAVIRELIEVPGLDLIIWRGGGYIQVKAAPPDKHFGVPFGDYRTN